VTSLKTGARDSRRTRWRTPCPAWRESFCRIAQLARAHELCEDALTRLAKAYLGLSAAQKDALDLSAQDVWDERMCAAGQDNDLVAFRQRYGAGSEQSWMPYGEYTLGEEQHEFFQWQGQFEFG
jgi:hypothetical protein